MRDETLRGAVLASLTCLAVAATFIIEVVSFGIGNLSWWPKILLPTSFAGNAYLCWLLFRLWLCGNTYPDLPTANNDCCDK